MIVVTNEFHVDPAHSEAFREAHRNPPPEEWFTDEGGVSIHEVEFEARR